MHRQGNNNPFSASEENYQQLSNESKYDCLYITGGSVVNLNCKTTAKGHEYMGRTSWTVSGRTCQAWTATSPQNPANHAKNPANFPDASIADASNYCRNTDGVESLWCYTTDPDVRGEFCDVPLCEDGKLICYHWVRLDTSYSALFMLQNVYHHNSIHSLRNLYKTNENCFFHLLS